MLVVFYFKILEHFKFFILYCFSVLCFHQLLFAGNFYLQKFTYKNCRQFLLTKVPVNYCYNFIVPFFVVSLHGFLAAADQEFQGFISIFKQVTLAVSHGICKDIVSDLMGQQNLSPYA